MKIQQHVQRHHLVKTLVNSPCSSLNYLSQCSMYELEFVDEFAHKNCFVLCDGFMHWGRHFNTNFQGVVLKENGVALHYLNTFVVKGRTYYIDAYGLFTSLDPIKARYRVDDEFFSLTVFDWSEYQFCKCADVVMMHEALEHIKNSYNGVGEYLKYRDSACRLLISQLVGFLGK